MGFRIREFRINAPVSVRNNIIFHVIAGVDDANKILRLEKGTPILILGYKTYGFGTYFKQYNPVESNLNQWKFVLPRILKRFHVCFDNLAVEQFDIKNRIGQENFDRLYMGDDGQHTMYIDAVTKQFAVSSTKDRYTCPDCDVNLMFRLVKEHSVS